MREPISAISAISAIINAIRGCMSELRALQAVSILGTGSVGGHLEAVLVHK
jgi:hypothetical protein